MWVGLMVDKTADPLVALRVALLVVLKAATTVAPMVVQTAEYLVDLTAFPSVAHLVGLSAASMVGTRAALWVAQMAELLVGMKEIQLAAPSD